MTTPDERQRAGSARGGHAVSAVKRAAAEAADLSLLEAGEITEAEFAQRQQRRQQRHNRRSAEFHRMSDAARAAHRERQRRRQAEIRADPVRNAAMLARRAERLALKKATDDSTKG